MNGVKCSWVEMLRRRRQLEAAQEGKDVAELRCVDKSAISQWTRSIDIIKAVEGSVEISQLCHFQPSHATEIARHFRKVSGSARSWDDDAKDSIVEWVEKCEENEWTVDRLKDELRSSILPDPSETDLEDVVTDLDEVIASGVKYQCIYADPPWQYNATAAEGSAHDQYRTISTADLCRWKVPEVAADNAHLHLWGTSPMLPDALRLMDAWGFEYKSSFIWHKPGKGLGHYWRINHEFLLLGVRGELRFIDNTIDSVLPFPRGKHSAKPAGVRALVERTTPGPRLELFGREQVSGWTVLGNQVARKDAST